MYHQDESDSKKQTFRLGNSVMFIFLSSDVYESNDFLE